MQIEHDENGGSEQPSCSDVGQILALRKMLEKEIEPMVLNIVQRVMKPMVITTVQQVMEPVAEDLFRRVVKEEIQSVEEKLLAGGTRNVLPKERNLHLKFLDKVCDPVQTGKKLKGTNDEFLKLALLDANGHVVCESSVKVEIVLLDDNGNDDGNILTHENFETRIIAAGDKEKPHFATNVYINLENGIGNLIDLKLGHGEKWTKLRNCRLGAKLAQNLPGTLVQEAWTAPFKVEDKRGKQYEKHYPPNLSSEVWRLDQIARNREPCKRLEKKNITTLQDFLFWFYVNPKGLQEILKLARDGMWKTIVTHALTCTIEDKRMFSYKSSNEPQMRVVYDVVGKLKGIINESYFVRIDNLSAEEKDHARTLLSSVLESPVFGDRYNTEVEASLLQEFPYRSSDISTSTNSTLQQCPNSSLQHCSTGSDLTLSENISGYQTTEQGSSAQSIDPSNFDDSGPSDSLGSKETGELCNPATGPFPDPVITDEGTPPVLCTLDYEKHEILSLSDEVSRLVNICKDGDIHKYLQDNKIIYVEDFLIQLLIDHEGLRKIVNLDREEWEATVSNARRCSISSRMYCYTSLEQKGVVFNVLGDVLGLCFNNYCYPTSMLSERDMADAQELLASACKNWNNVKPFNDMNHLQQQLTSGASEMVGESSSRRSNASFHSVSSTMETWCYDDDMWGLNEWCHGPPSPNPMLHYVEDNYSYNTRINGHRDEPGGDEGSGAASAEPQVVDQSNMLKKMFRRWFSRIDVTCSSHKKRKAG